MADVFISYVEEDGKTAKELAAALEKAGISTWYYERDTIPGREYLELIPHVIDGCAAMAVLISPSSLDSYQVKNEIVHAYEEQLSFLPVLVGVSYSDLQERQPVWRQAFGATVAIRLSDDRASDFARIATGAKGVLAKARRLKPAAARMPEPPSTGDKAIELALWNAVAESGDKDLLQSYLDQFPRGVFAAVARAKMVVLAKIPALQPVAPVPGAPDVRQSAGLAKPVPAMPDVSAIKRFASSCTDLNWSTFVETSSISSDATSLEFLPDGSRSVSLAFSPDRSHLVLAVSRFGKHYVEVCDPATGGVVIRLQGKSVSLDQPYDAVCVSPDGRKIAACQKGGNIYIWNAHTGALLTTLSNIFFGKSVAFSPNGEHVVVGSVWANVYVVEVASGTIIKTIEVSHHARSYSPWVRGSMSSDGSRIVTAASDGDVSVWRSDTGARVLQLKHNTCSLCDASFSEDGRFIAGVEVSKIIPIWRADTGEVVQELAGHTGWVETVRFSPDGTVVVSAASDKTLRLWNATTGDCLKVLCGHTKGLRCAVFSPDGTTIASAGKDGTIRIWSDRA